jgi:hypothetical protein
MAAGMVWSAGLLSVGIVQRLEGACFSYELWRFYRMLHQRKWSDPPFMTLDDAHAVLL